MRARRIYYSLLYWEKNIKNKIENVFDKDTNDIFTLIFFFTFFCIYIFLIFVFFFLKKCFFQRKSTCLSKYTISIYWINILYLLNILFPQFKKIFRSLFFSIQWLSSKQRIFFLIMILKYTHRKFWKNSLYIQKNSYLSQEFLKLIKIVAGSSTHVEWAKRIFF